jgi:hypothetical protein
LHIYDKREEQKPEGFLWPLMEMFLFVCLQMGKISSRGFYPVRKLDPMGNVDLSISGCYEKCLFSAADGKCLPDVDGKC